MDDPLPEGTLNYFLLFSHLAFPGTAFAVACVVISFIMTAFISSAEIAFFSLSEKQVEELKNEETTASRLVVFLKEDSEKLRTTLRFTKIILMIGLAASIMLMLELLIHLYSPGFEIFLQVSATVLLLIIFSEVTPKVYAANNPVKVVNSMAVPVRVLVFLLTPISWFWLIITTRVEKIFKQKEENISMDELSHALEITASEQTSENEKKILQGIVKFGNTEAAEIMTPRAEATILSSEANFKPIIESIIKSGFSRIPVYKDNIDNIIGVLFVKDLIPYIDEENYSWQQLLRPPFFVPPTKKIDDLLKEFQEKKLHLAIVVDEYGGNQGIITMEDIIEEIVGDISDEFDDETNGYSKIDEHTYIFEGKTTLEEVVELLKLEEKTFEASRGDADTLAGFILELEGKIPQRNAIINFRNLVFKIESADHKKIKSVRITLHTE